MIDDAEVNAALYKNRALAEYYLGLYQQGEADAKASSHAQPDAAAPYCVLAKVYGKTGQTVNERRAWQDFLAHFGSPILQARVEPDCVYLAQEVLHENR
jgi:predicted Zn-dependent protease